MAVTPQNLGELIHWSYANLAMAHHGVSHGLVKYNHLCFMIRAKLYKGLNDGTMSIRTLFDDEKVKLQTGQCCNYCGATQHLSLDHIFPQARGGSDNPENLVYACRTCNSSKGKKDLMQWMAYRNKFLSLMIIRRYLKLVYGYCQARQLLEYPVHQAENLNLPFDPALLPVKFPQPGKLVLSTCVLYGLEQFQSDARRTQE